MKKNIPVSALEKIQLLIDKACNLASPLSIKNLLCI